MGLSAGAAIREDPGSAAGAAAGVTADAASMTALLAFLRLWSYFALGMILGVFLRL